MKIVKDHSNQPLTPAEAEACRQFEQSDRDGQALFHPQMAAGQPAPDCIVSCPKIGRLAITILPGPYSVDGVDWYRHQANGIETPVPNPLKGVWQAAMAVRSELKRELDVKAYVFAVAWFPDMVEDRDILQEAEGSGVKLCFGEADLVRRLLSLPREDELQTNVSDRSIEREVALLSRAAAAGPRPAAAPGPVNGPAGALNVGTVETMNVYINIANGGDDDPPLITVQGQ